MNLTIFTNFSNIGWCWVALNQINFDHSQFIRYLEFNNRSWFWCMFSTWTFIWCTYMTHTSNTQFKLVDTCLINDGKCDLSRLEIIEFFFSRISILKPDFPHTRPFPVDWCNKTFWHDFSQKKLSGIKCVFYPTQPHLWLSTVKCRLSVSLPHKGLWLF